MCRGPRWARPDPGLRCTRLAGGRCVREQVLLLKQDPCSNTLIVRLNKQIQRDKAPQRIS